MYCTVALLVVHKYLSLGVVEVLGGSPLLQVRKLYMVERLDNLSLMEGMSARTAVPCSTKACRI